MASTTTVTIHDEASRRVVFQMLWNHACNQANGETFSNRLYEYAWTSIDARLGVPTDDCDASERLFELMDLLVATRAAAEQVETLELGASVEVPFDSATLVDLADQCRGNIEDDEDFWRIAKADQDRIVSCRNAAVRLLDEYREMTMAVA